MTKTILILTANPRGTSEARLDEEVRDIQAGLQRSRYRDEFVLRQQWATQPRDIQRAMLDCEPQIVHFSGQGAGEAGLMFEDETGQPKIISGEALAALFKLYSQKLECVVLNRCYSQMQAEAIAQHVPYVVGMKQALEDRAAIEFSVGFYDALMAGKSVEFAYNSGCVAIGLGGAPGERTPILLRGAVPSVSSSVHQPIKIFFSYAQEDLKLRDKLANHLKLLERQKLIESWSDQNVTGGGDLEEIEQQLNAAQVILLLISDDFLVSDFCWGDQMMRALERHEAKQARVIPIIVREVDWSDAPFSKLQPLPRNKQAIASSSNLDQALTEISKEIRRVVEQLKAEQSAKK